MKQLLIILNVITLIFGNILFLNIHSSQDDCHGHVHIEEQECLKCLNIESNSNYIADSHELDFSDNIVSQLELQHQTNEVFSVIRKYNSRAPPIS